MSVFFPVIELLDRLVIAKIKLSKSGFENQTEYDYYNSQASRYDLSNIAELLEELESVHLQIWALESELRRGLEANIGYEEIGRRAVDIRNFNNQRIQVKNKMAEILGCDVREIKIDHISQ
jgi:hypothetical protein